jgi:uncharacterized protein
MKALVEYVVKSLVEKPDSVDISIESIDSGKIIKIKVDESDKGRVIGKEGKIIKAVRQLVFAAATKKGEKYRVEIDE